MAQLALALLAAVMVFLLVCVRIGEKRWEAMGLDLNGREPPGEWGPKQTAAEGTQP